MRRDHFDDKSSMKKCPQCGREYDLSMSFCLDDGAELLYGPSSEEPPTAMFYAADADGDAPTLVHDHTTERTASLPSGIADVPRKSLDKRLLAVPLFLALTVAAGFIAYRYAGPVADARIRSIAVLPFENRSGSPDAEYLSDGLADSLIFRFSQLPDLKVSPTSSVMRYKGTAADVAEIASKLDVDAVLSGRLLQVGDSLNVSVQLIDARTGKLIWAEKYDRQMADLLATQREIATVITQKLQLKLAPNEKGITKKYTSNNEAYQLYLKGRFHWAKRKKDDMLTAVNSFKQAIALDPNFALAYVGIAEAYNSMGKNPDIPPKEAIPLAKSAALRALELDPTLAEAHSALADSLAIGDWDWAASEREFKRAIELDPNIAYVHVAYSGSFLTAAGRTEEAVVETARALEMEPISLVNNALHVTSLVNARRFDEALVQARRAYDLDHGFPLARHWLGLALSANGKYDEAIALGSEVQADSPILPIGLFISAYAHARAGRHAEAERIIALMHAAEKTHYVRPYYIACVWSALGDKDKAFAELERSFAEKDCYLPRMRVDPLLDRLRDDPRYKDLLKRMNLPE